MSVVFKSMSLCSDDIVQELYGFRQPRVIFKSMSICGAMYRILKVVDSDGNAISGASVSISDSGDYSESGTTESDGTYSSFLNGDTITNPVTVEITKTGYQPRTRETTITERPDWDVVLYRKDEISVQVQNLGQLHNIRFYAPLVKYTPLALVRKT